MTREGGRAGIGGNGDIARDELAPGAGEGKRLESVGRDLVRVNVGMVVRRTDETLEDGVKGRPDGFTCLVVPVCILARDAKVGASYPAGLVDED